MTPRQPAYLGLPKTHHFDYQYLLGTLQDYRSPRDKISKMIAGGEIIRVKKGIYVLAPRYGGQIDLRTLGNVVYGPSYISGESALSYWGMIPERVEEVVSMTTGRKKRFSTPLGTFVYRHIAAPAFSAGLQIEKSGRSSFLIASREKALCDMAAGARDAASPEDIESYVFDDLRVDRDSLDELDTGVLRAIARVYRRRTVGLLTHWCVRRTRQEREST